MKNIDSQNSITENDTQDLPLICVSPHTSSAEIFGRRWLLCENGGRQWRVLRHPLPSWCTYKPT